MHSSLTELAFRLIKYMIPRDPRIHQQKFNQEGMQPNTPLINQSNQKHLRCATELQAAGIRIKGARTENLLDINGCTPAASAILEEREGDALPLNVKAILGSVSNYAVNNGSCPITAVKHADHEH
ncbi:hypothetical protein NC651_020324 [Populus alba x Populus x berolinensis]|nr:hypothetical protein NC651_020324 [Populus alba x Populus x berolinensis]